MNDITKGSFNMPAVPDDLADLLGTGIAESRATTVLGGGGKSILRMGKDGIWIYGASNDEVEEHSRWVVNIMTLAHGFCCWTDGGPGQKNTLAGEVMQSMTEPKPARPAPIGATPYAEQRSFELRCLDGEDAGVEVIYKTASYGGMNAVDDLLAQIQRALARHRQKPAGSTAYIFPVLDLLCSSYDHTKYGKIYNPVLKVVGWSDTNGELEGATKQPPPPPPPEPVAAAKRTRKPVQVPEPEPVVEAPVSTTQAHTGQRRRPAAR